MFGAMIPPFKRYPLAIRVLLMFSMFLFNMSVISYLAILLAQQLFGLEDAQQILEGTFNSGNDLNAFLFIQGFTSILGFALTSMMVAVLESGEFINHLRVKMVPSIQMVLLAIVAIITAQFFIDFLVKINQLIPIPEALSGLKEMQKNAEKLTNAMMNFTSVGQLFIVSIVVAVIPAIVEEFFFRGLLLGDLLKAKIRPALAIPVTGFIFALIHFEFDNMLAIWALGSFLGYLYYVSGSLWLPIAAHFVNNFFAVLVKYLINVGVITSELANSETPLYITLLSFVFFGGTIYLFNKWRNKPNFIEEEEVLDDSMHQTD